MPLPLYISLWRHITFLKWLTSWLRGI